MKGGKDRFIVLLAHGSRDPRWRQPFEHLKEVAAAGHPFQVSLAYLQLGEPTLEQALRSCQRAGAEEVVLVPLFMSGGGHLLRDMPQVVAAAADRVGIEVRCKGALGEEPEVVAAMVDAVRRLAGSL